MNRRTARLAILVLAVAACVNLAAGATLALTDPTRASDLRLIYNWCGLWLGGGKGLYTAPGAATDYPPNAIVMLAPVALLPWSWVVHLWTAFGLALAPILGYLVIRCVSRGSWFTTAVPMLLFLCWQSTRTPLQFTALSMTFAFLSVRLMDSHRLASGVALGLALFKPHIAGPIALWAVLSGRARVAMVAAAVVLAGWAAYDARIGENPIATLDGYFGVLALLHAGAYGLIGRTGLRGWTRFLAADPRAADAWWVVLSVSLLAVVWWLARRDPRRPLEAGGLAVLSLLCLWSLVTFYHNTNNLIMMLPAFVFLWFLDDPDDRAASWWRWAPIVSLQAALMFDVPTRLAPRMSQGTWQKVAVDDFDRLVVLVSFAYVALRWYRLTSRPQPPAPYVTAETAENAETENPKNSQRSLRSPR